MRDPRLNQLAEIMVKQCLSAKRNQKVLIKSSSPAGIPLLEACFEAALKAKTFPDYRIGSEQLTEFFFSHANSAQLANPPKFGEYEAKFFDAHINIYADEDTASLSQVPGEKIALRAKLSKNIREIIQSKSWVLTYYPTAATAQAAGLSLHDLEEFFFAATLIDWTKLANKLEKITATLNNTKLHFIGKKTDLSLSTVGKKWIADDWKCNLPGGEIFTSPIPESVEGQIYFDYPLTHQGKEIRDIHLTLKAGRVVHAVASTHQDYLEKLLDTDEGARGVGEIAFGVNEGCTRFMNNVLFDEKMAGTIHLALGAGFAETGPTYNSSGLHLDIIKDMHSKNSQVFANEKLIYQAGKFTI